MNNFLPVKLLKDIIILPNLEIKLETTKEDEIIIISNKHHNGTILLVSPKDLIEENPSINDLPLIGVVATIKNIIDLPNGNIRLTLLGGSRVKVLSYKTLEDNKNILMASVTTTQETLHDIVEETAIKRKLIKTLTRYINISHTISNSVLSQITKINDLDKLTDIVTSFVPLSLDKKITYMNEVDSIVRANNLIYDLSVEIEVCELDEKIEETLREEMENSQKEYILKEKIKYIKKELGEEENVSSKYYNLLDDLVLSDKTKRKIASEIKRLDNLVDGHPEYAILQNYLDTVLNLPWNKVTDEENDLNNIRKSLDKSHYGLNSVKERILEYAAIKKRNKEVKSPIICLVGPPGVGKTSISIAIAKALNREFYKFSVGGLNDVTELTGNRRTYLGSSMGRIMQAISKCNTKNPVILIDEVDKMVKNNLSDPASALLEIVDPEQNSMFIDNYIEEPFDLSQVMFIMSANDIDNIPYALYDRLEIINLSSYTLEEKINIAKKYLIPKIYKNYKIKEKEIKIKEDAIKVIIQNYTKEAGLRELNRKLEKLIRKVILTNGDKELNIEITKNSIKDYLGESEFENTIDCVNKEGVVNTLCYTNYGGCTMLVECCMFQGKGEIITTGSLGTIITESIEVSISYIRSNKDAFLVNDYFFDNRDIHIHFLEGATPKEGPSAGVAITTSILSLLLHKEIPRNIAMTGEISLNGDVLEVGGIKEKLIASYNNNIKTVFIPLTNIKDLKEIPNSILKNIEVIGVSNYMEIFKKIF